MPLFTFCTKPILPETVFLQQAKTGSSFCIDLHTDESNVFIS